MKRRQPFNDVSRGRVRRSVPSTRRTSTGSTTSTSTEPANGAAELSAGVGDAWKPFPSEETAFAYLGTNAFGSSMDMSTMRMLATMARLSHRDNGQEQKRKLKAMKPAVLNKCRDKIREVFESFAPVEIYTEDFQFHSIPLRQTFRLMFSNPVDRKAINFFPRKGKWIQDFRDGAAFSSPKFCPPMTILDAQHVYLSEDYRIPSGEIVYLQSWWEGDDGRRMAEVALVSKVGSSSDQTRLEIQKVVKNLPLEALSKQGKPIESLRRFPLYDTKKNEIPSVHPMREKCKIEGKEIPLYNLPLHLCYAVANALSGSRYNQQHCLGVSVAGLNPSKLEKTHSYFYSATNLVRPKQMMDHFLKEMNELHENPSLVWDPLKKRKVFLQPTLLSVFADEIPGRKLLRDVVPSLPDHPCRLCPFKNSSDSLFENALMMENLLSVPNSKAPKAPLSSEPEPDSSVEGKDPDSLVLDVDKVNPVDILTTFFQGLVYHLWSMTEDSVPRESQWKVKAVFNASPFVKFEPSEYDFDDEDVEPGDVFFGISREYSEGLIQMAQSAAVALYPLKGGLIKDEIWEAWNVVGMLGRDLMTEKIASVDSEDYLRALSTNLQNTNHVMSKLDPKSLLLMTEFHSNLHLVDQIRQLGPAIGFTADRKTAFEKNVEALASKRENERHDRGLESDDSFDSDEDFDSDGDGIQGASRTKSHDPSKDLSLRIFDQTCLRHLLSAGFIPKDDASPQVYSSLLGPDLVKMLKPEGKGEMFMKDFGLVDDKKSKSNQPGSFWLKKEQKKGEKTKSKVPAKALPELTANMCEANSKVGSFACTHVTSLEGDIIGTGTFALSCNLTSPTVSEQNNKSREIVYVLALYSPSEPGSPCSALVERTVFSTEATGLPHRLRQLKVTKGRYYLIPVKYLICRAPVSHDCKSAGCEITEKSRGRFKRSINHSKEDVNVFLLNRCSLKFFEEMKHLYPPSQPLATVRETVLEMSKFFKSNEKQVASGFRRKGKDKFRWKKKGEGRRRPPSESSPDRSGFSSDYLSVDTIDISSDSEASGSEESEDEGED